jgi:hypothetical protein
MLAAVQRAGRFGVVPTFSRGRFRFGMYHLRY